MSKRYSAVTIGVFDGVHIGHAAVIKKTVHEAKVAGLKSVAVTFDPHPMKVLDPRHFVPSLISLKHRIALIKALGIDEVVVMKFNRRMASLPAEEFIKGVVIKNLNAKKIVVGEDFMFGRAASAGIDELREIAKKYLILLKVVAHVKDKGRVISSTLIRRLILEGSIDEASYYLGRPFSILGTVVSGTKLARELGYPTANVNPHHEVIPPTGVYAVDVIYKGKKYKGVMNIGTRPTFFAHGHDKEPTIEVHIFNFRERIYGKDLEITFMKKLREEKKFKTIDNLIKQIKKDEQAARKI